MGVGTKAPAYLPHNFRTLVFVKVAWMLLAEKGHTQIQKAI